MPPITATPIADPNASRVDISGNLLSTGKPAAATSAAPVKQNFSVNGKTYSAIDEADANQLAAADLGVTIPGSSGVDVSGITSTSGTTRADNATLGSNISGMSAPTYQSPTLNLGYLTDFENSLRSDFAAGNTGINSSYDSQEQKLSDTQARETGSQSANLARIGGYLGNSASGTGAALTLAQTHRSEMADLESKRQAALGAARTAYNSSQFSVAKEEADKAQSYEQEAYTRQQKFQTDTQAYLKTQKAAQDEANVVNALQKGAKTPADVYKALNGAVDLDTINSVIKGYTPTSSGAFNFTPADTGKLLGAGLSADEIAQVHDYVNTNGYTDAFRASLTAKERTVLDSIYNPKTAAAGVGGSLSIAEAKSLGLPVSLIGKTEQQVVADLQSSTPPSWYQEYVTSGWADPNAQVNPEGLAKDWDAFRSQVLGQNIAGNKYAVNSTKSSSLGGSTADASLGDYSQY